MGDDNRRRLELRDMEPPPSPPQTHSWEPVAQLAPIALPPPPRDCYNAPPAISPDWLMCSPMLVKKHPPRGSQSRSSGVRYGTLRSPIGEREPDASTRGKPESTEGRPWGQPLKKLLGAPLNLG